MDESRLSDGAVVPALLAVVLVILLVAGGGAVFMWQRQTLLHQEAIAARERAVAEAAEAAAIQRRLAQASQADGRSEVSDGFSFDAESAESAIRTVLESQQRAWNAGDIDQFMEYYWKSDKLTFSAGGKLTRSWRGTLENYKKRYPSRVDMGELAFQNLEVMSLGPDAAMVLGEWRLNRTVGELGGNFTLILRRFGDQWVIVHDHTSRTEPE